jgi:hypothetical protein
MDQTGVIIGVGNMYEEFLGDNNMDQSSANNDTNTSNDDNSNNGDNDNIDNDNIKSNNKNKESYFKVNKLPFNFDTWQADFITSHTYKR